MGVDPSLFAQEDKENVSLGRNRTQMKAQPGAVSMVKPTEDREAQKRLAEQEARQAADRLAADIARREQAEREKRAAAEREAAELQAEEDARLKKEEDDARAAAELAERSRQTEDAERQRQEKEQERIEAQKQAAITKAQAYLTANRFADVNALRKSTWKAKRPLHSAVKANDAETVLCLLLAGADPSLTNSGGKTPRQVAELLNKNDSHTAVLAALPA